MVMMVTLMGKTSLDNCTCGGAPPSWSWNAPQGPRCARGAFNFEAWWLEFVMIKPVGGPNSSDLVKDIDARPLCEANHQVIVVSLKKPSPSVVTSACGLYQHQNQQHLKQVGYDDQIWEDFPCHLNMYMVTICLDDGINQCSEGDDRKEKITLDL